MTIEEEHLDLVRRLTKKPTQILSELNQESVQCWHMVTGLATEAIELLRDITEFIKTTYPETFDMENFIKELGDYEFYLTGLMDWCTLERKPCTQVFNFHDLNTYSTVVELALNTSEILDQCKAYVINNKPLDLTDIGMSVYKIEECLQKLRTWLDVSREEVLRVNIDKLTKRQPTGKYVDAHAIERRDEKV